MQMPDQDTINSLLRQGYTAAGTALTIGTLIAVVPQEAVQPTIAALHDIGDGLQKAIGGFSSLIVIFGPIIMGLSAKAAAFAVSLKSQVAKVHEAAPHELMSAVQDVTPGTLAKATAALPGVQVTVSSAAAPSLRILAADNSQPDIVKASSAPPVAPPVTQGQKP